jgi:hypothetical protein
MRNRKQNDTVRGVKSIISKAANAAAAAAATVIAENIVRQLRPGSSGLPPGAVAAVKRLLDDGGSRAPASAARLAPKGRLAGKPSARRSRKNSRNRSSKSARGE